MHNTARRFAVARIAPHAHTIEPGYYSAGVIVKVHLLQRLSPLRYRDLFHRRHSTA
jgi:hypothetical protein